MGSEYKARQTPLDTSPHLKVFGRGSGGEPFFKKVSPGRLFFANATVGGQAVMEGVMIRNKDRLAIAVRRPGGEILLETRPWFSLTRKSWLKKPFIRGFPVLLETLVNGIKALNFSAHTALEDETDGEVKPWTLALTLIVSIGIAMGLFVVLPHLISLALKFLGLSGGTESLSFHVWDGFFKLAVFLGYIAGISLLPDIRRVFEYHGAEHKVIWAYESGAELAPGTAKNYSRLHPRCGTAFLLFVLTLSILLHAVFIPGLLALYAPQGAVVKQVYVLAAKFLIIVPVSGAAFEMIKLAGRSKDTGLCKFLCRPGLMLQRLTTREPDEGQLEVAIAALKGALAKSGA